MLDAGAYGQVYDQDGRAVKVFKKINHTVQEYIALIYLSSSPRIVKVHSCCLTLTNPTITMELMDGNLASWYSRIRKKLQRNEIDYYQYRALMKNVLLQLIMGICDIHDRKLTHGDIKPGNILVNNLADNKVQLYIGDCGFVSLARYCKTERTARSYRDPNPQHHYGHDIYSYAIIFLQLYGMANIYNQFNDSSILADMISENIKERSYQDVLFQMIHPQAEMRPTARQCLYHLFNQTLPSYTLAINTNFIGKPLTEEEKQEVRNFILHKTNKYELNRGHKSYSALLFFLQSEKIERGEHILYAIALLYVINAIFAHTSKNFTWPDVLKLCTHYEYNEGQFLVALQLLINNIDFVELLMYDE